VNEIRVFFGISEVHPTFHQVATIIIHVSEISPSKASFLEGIKWLKTAENSRKIALRRASTVQKKIACGAGLRQLCEASTFVAGVPTVCQIFARKAGQGPALSTQCLHARNPSIFSIRILHFQMDRVAVAQLIYPETSTETCLRPFFLPMWLTFFDFANHDHMSLFATFQSHSSISSIRSVNQLQCHCSNVRANCASIMFFTTSSCRMHWTTCCSKACVSTSDGRGHSWPPSAVGMVYREFAVDHGTCHTFVHAWTWIFCRPSNSYQQSLPQKKLWSLYP